MSALLAVALVAVVGLSGYLFVSSVLDIATSPVRRIRRRTRELGLDESGALGRTASTPGLLSWAIAASERGAGRRVADTFRGFAVILDSTGVKADAERTAQAGLRNLVTPEQMIRARAWLGVVTGGVLGLATITNGVTAVMFFAVGFALGARVPSFALASAAQKRLNECIRSLPEMIDMIALGSRAGMSFDNALATYCDRFEGPLSESFGSALEKWRVGAETRETALQALADDMGVEVVGRFVSAVLQALRLGSPLARVLEDQAQDARKEQKAAVEAEIAQAPVKMFIPLGTLILPAMLILMLGPIILQLVTTLSSAGV